jgi:sialidase-1
MLRLDPNTTISVLPDMSIACLFERGDTLASEKITFARFSLEWLTDGQDSIEIK